MVVKSCETEAHRLLDARGMSCPLPLLKAKLALNEMIAGEVLHVRATDAGSKRDFERFAELSGHALLGSVAEGGEFQYWLRKKA